MRSTSRASTRVRHGSTSKCTAINGDWIRTLAVDDLADRMLPFLQRDGVLEETIVTEQRELLIQATPLVQERMETLGQAPGMLGFLFATDDFAVDPDDAQKMLNEQGLQVVGLRLGGGRRPASSPPTRSSPRCVKRWWTRWASSRSWRSDRCG